MSARFSPRRLLADFRYKRLLRRMAGPKLLRAFASVYPRPFFVELGANDGIQHDFLRPFVISRPWSGIMVEPVPYVFERLRANYAGFDRVILENAAISDRDGTLPFYHLAPASEHDRQLLPQWYDGIGSFSRETVLRHAQHIPDVEDRLVRVQIPALTFSSLLERHGVKELDLLVIDTEGYDWEIIRHLDLSRHAPKLLVYEHFHLHPSERTACRKHVERGGYETMEEGFDTFCLSWQADRRLRRRWARLRPAIDGVSEFDQPTR